MSIEKRFPVGTEERKKVAAVFSGPVLNMMDSDRPNNMLTGGLNFIGVVRGHQESGQRMSLKDKALFALASVIEGVCRTRASQLGWVSVDVDEEINRGRQIYRKNHGEE